MSGGFLHGFEALYKALEFNDEASPEQLDSGIEMAAAAYVLQLRRYSTRISDESIPRTFMLSLKTLKDIRFPNLYNLIKELSFLLKGSPELVLDLNYFLPSGFDVYCDIGSPNVEFVVIRDSKFSARIEGVSSELPESVPCDFVALRATLNDSTKTKKLVSESKGSLASAVLQLLQFEIDNQSDRTSLSSQITFKTLQDLSYKSGKLPPSLYIRSVVRMGEFPIGGGGFSDIWKGQSLSGDIVCLKILRMNITPDIEKFLKRCYKEVLVWRMLRNPRVLEFYGVYIVKSQNDVRFGLVSPWLENGSVMEYIKAHPDFDRMKAIREVVDGLYYLHHSESVVHGDIKGDNIFVRPDLTCCLGDFGLATSAWSPALPMKSSSSAGLGSTRWMAPELLNPKPFENDQGSPLASDIYALGCTALEILTGKVPWSEIQLDTQVLIEVIQGHKPSLPADISYDVGWVLEQTWEFWPKKRRGIQWLKPSLEPSFRAPARPTALQRNKSNPFQWKLGTTSVTAKNSARTLWRSASKR
ncbi:kinase-like domain-containing protein [Desarmillaria tabescens]|uniref:Kinase-like domain-containing protein n=1 Tax=Armillaria tabescens TaxID=1929756 RepID=A0AA39MWV4_ARMTA|nr:kinase-like domain-containing protein [Desarmillaria tabescens]KAK0449597.1 kinase-like domain-containing protein [Desarmillaria tabescens]